MAEVQSPFEVLVQIDQRCRQLAAGLPAQREVAQSWNGIGFRMAGRLFVAPMGEVGEVLHEPRYTLLPGVRDWVRGVANVRGRLLPIMDLCGFLGAELSPLRKQRRVLVVEHQEVFAGLIVDEVFGMQHFPVETFSEQLPPLEAVLQPFIHGVFNREQPWLVFSPHALAQHPAFLDVAS
ncbi:chemotaxis protein CheW [Pseudomonas sp. MT3]|uniref:chemotaxis protein CheW n=1 Tax=Pseudomonas sp. ATCC 13867 TaxID=1294143 RepID=UPI0002C4F79C|nr:chemotaxis protein CheW [Pseudomonas sp. ATCC 13867]AGI22256.1 twitching motility protein PilI [Pseudomonas sp. ATCC 13867]RFQ39207.1 chemotaxis protein CheW [Pseudomonas sp. ATCC 13867]